MNTINIPQEVIEQLVQKEIEKQVNSQITPENLNRYLNRLVRERLNLDTVNTHIDTIMNNQLAEPHSYLNTSITTRIDRFINEWFTNNKWKMEQQINQSITTVIRSPLIYDKFIEPQITKFIAQDQSFIPYVKNEVHMKLNEKIKSFNKTVGTNISTTLVQEFLRNYISNRGLDDENLNKPESKD